MAAKLLKREGHNNFAQLGLPACSNIVSGTNCNQILKLRLCIRVASVVIGTQYCSLLQCTTCFPTLQFNFPKIWAVLLLRGLFFDVTA